MLVSELLADAAHGRLEVKRPELGAGWRLSIKSVQAERTGLGRGVSVTKLCVAMCPSDVCVILTVCNTVCV